MTEVGRVVTELVMRNVSKRPNYRSLEMLLIMMGGITIEESLAASARSYLNSAWSMQR